MSCYFRHLNDILKEAGIQVTPANRKQVDRAFHQAAGVPYKDCPAAWKKLKATLTGDEAARRALVQKLKTAMAETAS